MLKTAIPFVDLRGRTPIDLLRAYPDKGRALVKSVRRTYGAFSDLISSIALPFADRRSKAWLERTGNPFLHEIESCADILKVRGVYALNLCYEWGCTSGAYRTGDTVSMLRVLDWPFPSLGRQIMVVWQQGKAGEYFNVTWPGVSGVFNAMAPGRFSAAVNLAPMRRHRLTFVGDWIKNRSIAARETGIPPSHLLRQVFDQATDYAQAKEMLMKTPIAVPAIFILAGTQPGEGCVIERLEQAAEARELSAGLSIIAANHFSSGFAAFGHGWRAREIDSAGRYRQGCAITGHDLGPEDFSWLRVPIINRYTRLCIIGDAATRRLTVQGFEGSVAVTEIFKLPAAAGQQAQAQRGMVGWN